MIITISGFHGTGKTSVAKAIAKEFKLRYISAGTLFRQMAKDHEMTLTEFSQYVTENPEIDREIDGKNLEESKKGNVVLEGLLVAWITKEIQGINILLIADEPVRIERISRRENRPYEEVKIETLTREKIEIDRFKNLYGIDLNDYAIYDIVLNTKLWTEKAVIRIVTMLINEHLKSIQKTD